MSEPDANTCTCPKNGHGHAAWCKFSGQTAAASSHPTPPTPSELSETPKLGVGQPITHNVKVANALSAVLQEREAAHARLAQLTESASELQREVEALYPFTIRDIRNNDGFGDFNDIAWLNRAQVLNALRRATATAFTPTPSSKDCP